MLVIGLGLFSYMLIANAVTTTCSTNLSSPGTYTLTASTTNTCNITSAGVILDGGGFAINQSITLLPFPDNATSTGWFNMTSNKALYHLNESFGTLADSSGNGNTLTAVGTITYGQPGTVGNSVRLDGTSSYLIKNSPTGLATGNTDFSYSYFVKLDGSTFTNDQRVPFFYGQASQSNNIHNDLNYNGVSIDVSRYGGVICASPSSFTVDTWHNVSVTKSGSTFRLYIDGSQVCTSQVSLDIIASKLIINDWGDTGYGYSVNGVWYDEIAFWNRTLSPSEVSSIYANQFYLETPAVTGNGYGFNINNLVTVKDIISAGATINIANSTVAIVNVSGTNSSANGQAGGIINLTNTTAGALFANGGNSTDYGQGGAAGSFSLISSSATSQTANAGSCGPNAPNSLNCPNIFTNQGSGDWDDTSNWSNGTIPDSSTYVDIRSSIYSVSSGSAYAQSAIFTSGSFSTYSSLYVGGDVTFTSSISGNEYGYIYVDGGQIIFIGDSYNQGSVYNTSGEISFYNSSANYGNISAGNTNFYDSSYINSGYLYGDTNIFHEDLTNLNSFNITNPNPLIRTYSTSTVSARNFINDYSNTNQAWIVTATTSVTIDLSNAYCDSHTTFVANGGSFVFGPNCTGGPAGISILIPTSNAALNNFSSVIINWNQGVGGYNYSSCQFSFGDISNFNTSTSAWTNGNLWQGASCTGTGQEIAATSTYSGNQILAIRAFYNSIATSSIVNFIYQPSRFLYFYNSGSNSSWSTVGNWYTDIAHTISAGSLPTSIDKITVVGSTIPTVDLDSWVQPTLINSGQTGIAFTGASNASTSVAINGKATFNNYAKNKGRINGNVIFNDNSSNLVGGRANNAIFNSSSTNAGTISINGTFYGDISENTGTVSAIKTRYYNATATTTRNFTNGWTVTADGVAVTIASSTQFNTNTKFKTVNGGYFIGGPTAVYFWSSSNIFNSWTSISNWYSDAAATIALGYLPTATSTIVTLGSVAPSVDLDSIDWVTPSGIDASQTGISFTSTASASINTGITGTTTFNGNSINLSTILGNVTFASSTKNSSGGIILGNVTFNTNSRNNGGLITGNVVFNSNTLNTNSSEIFGDVTFNNSSINGTTTGFISGTATFYNTSRNDGIIDNDAIFYENTTNNNNTVSGTQTRYFTSNATTTRNFVNTGPWTLVANNAIVHLGDTSVFNATTTFSKLNGGNFTGEGVPGSYTTCTKSLVLPGVYTMATSTAVGCDIQIDGVTIDGGGNMIGNQVLPFPDNATSTGWVNMSGNVALYHMNENVGTTTTDSSGNGNNGGNSFNVISDFGIIDYARNLTNYSYINIPQSSSMDLSITDRFTFSAWVKPFSSYGGAVFIQRANCDGNYQYQFYLNQLTFQNPSGQNQTVFPNHTFTTNEWVHIAGTYDGANLKYYVNGQLDNVNNIGSVSINPNTTSSKIGYDTCGTSFHGLIDEAAIWNRSLSPSEILNIYNNQNFGNGNTAITGNNHNFNITNLVTSGYIISAGATINIANSTVATVNVSGVNRVADGQVGGTINLTNTTAGAMISNGGNSTDYGYGGLGGSRSMTNSTATSWTHNNGSDGPNLISGQGTSGGGGSIISGCTDPNASNYNSNATADNGSCRYPTVQIYGCMNPSASNYNPNATINTSCTYSTYNPYTPLNSGSTGGAGSNNNVALGGNLSGRGSFIGSLILDPLNPFGLGTNNQLGFTYFGNPLEGLQSVGNLNLNPITLFNANFAISNFLFAPLPKSITDALNRSAKLASVVTSVGITRAQDLVSLGRKPIKLLMSDDTPGLFVVTNGTTTLDNYLTSDLNKGLVQLVYVNADDVLNVNLTPLSTGKVTGKFDGKDISFIQSPGKMVSSIITAPTIPGKYFLTTQSAPLPLMVEVLSSSPQTPSEPPGFWNRLRIWFSRLFH